MEQKKELEHARDMIGQLEHIIENIQIALDYRTKVKAEGKVEDPAQLQREIIKLELDLLKYKSFLEGWKAREKELTG